MQPFMKDSAEVNLMLSLREAIIRVCDYEHDDGQEQNMRCTALTTRMFITWVLKAITDVGSWLVEPGLRRDVHICGCKIIDRICYHEDTVRMWVQHGAPQAVGEVMKLYQNDPDIDWNPIFWAFWHLACKPVVLEKTTYSLQSVVAKQLMKLIQDVEIINTGEVPRLRRGARNLAMFKELCSSDSLTISRPCRPHPIAN